MRIMLVSLMPVKGGDSFRFPTFPRFHISTFLGFRMDNLATKYARDYVYVYELGL